MQKPSLPYSLARKVVKKIFDIILDIKVEGLDNIPEDGRFILVSNHLNWSDPFYYYAYLPSASITKLIFVAEYDGIYDTFLKKKFIDLMGKPILPIDRNDPHSRITALKSMFKVVKEGNILAIFPEGRIGHAEGELFPFHVGVFSVARKLKIPILPATIAGTKELSLRKPVKIRFAEPEYCHKNESDEDFARRMARTILETMPDYPGDGPYPYRLNWLTGLCQGELRPFTGADDLIIPTGREKRKIEK